MCCIISLTHITSELVISSCIGHLQVKFVFEVFKKLRPGIPLKCMHGRMKHEVQQAIVADFNENTSVLFSTDISSRGLDIKNVDWVVQVYHFSTAIFLYFFIP
jgi:superfamily II DNA/RNA helicase